VRTTNKSARRSTDHAQLHLLTPPPKAQALPYTIDQVRACPNEVAAIELACRCSGLLDKQIADSLSMDEGNWSKLRRGQRGFMPGYRIYFMEVVGNQILREWEEESLGYDSQSLRVHRSELEQQLEDERAARVETERENAVLRQLITGRKP
jgi:hypothetical protein